MTSGAVTLWLADHPRIRRAVVAMTLSYTLSLLALLCAPQAVASGGSAVLGWTGLRDTEGVPIAYYFLSLVSVREAATNNGQEISAFDPTSWAPWMAAAMERAVDNATAAWWLGMFSGAFIFVIAVSLWLLRFALSTGWLLAIATLGQPLYNAVSAYVNQMMLAAIAVTICAIIGGYHVLRGEPGRGWAMVGTAIILTVLLATVFTDPIRDLYSDDGLLALGRGTGLEIAQGATGAPFASGASLDAKLDALLSHVVTAGVRHPLQVLNFGMVVDDIGGCRQAWSSAMMAAQGVDGAGPAHAMVNCGAPQALAYAQRLGGGDAALAFVLVLVAVVVGFFFWYVGLTVMLVGVKALYFGILVGPSMMLGMVGVGRALAFAKHCGTELFMHAFQLLVFEVYLAVSAIALTWVLTSQTIGPATATAIPRILLMAVAAAVLWMGFRWVDHKFHTDGMGTIGRQIRSAWHAGTGAAREEAASYRDTARSVRDRMPRRGRDDSAGEQDSSGGSATKPVPGIEWFKPRSSSSSAGTGLTPTPGTATGGAASRSAAKSTAKSVAKTAALDGLEVAAPEVAVPAAAAAKAAGAAGHVLKSRKDANGQTSGSRGQGSGGDVSPAPLRQPRAEPATSTAAAGEPAQAATMASRSTEPAPSAHADPDARAPRGPATPAGTIDNDVPRHNDNPQPRAARPPRPPREIGP